MLFCVVLCRVVLCYVVLCCVVLLCCAVLCCFVLCYVVQVSFDIKLYVTLSVMPHHVALLICVITTEYNVT